jgi:hypothetical protein
MLPSKGRKCIGHINTGIPAYVTVPSLKVNLKIGIFLSNQPHELD